MEHVTIKLANDKAFDDILKQSLPEGSDLTVITKDNATVGGNPAIMFTFTVQLPSGLLRTAQAVTTVSNFKLIAAAIKGRYGE